MTGRPMTILGAVVAVLALGAFLLLGNRGGGGPAASVATTPVVVAARDVSLRVPLTAADLQLVKMPSTAVPPQTFDKTSQLIGLVPTVNIYKGQPVEANLLVASSDQVSGAQAAFLPIPKGFVAKTIPTSEQQGVAFFINAGDYITIEGLVSGPKYQNERTIYTNIHVLRTGPASANLTPVTKGAAAATPAPSSSQGATSLTIVVTQCQAEIIDWFIANGTIKYTLESYHDYVPSDQNADPTCPGVTSAGGVTAATINARYPGLLGG